MTDHFIERLIAKTTTTTGGGSSISIRPAITPDVLPETFYLPEQRIPSRHDVFDIIHAKDVVVGKSDTSHSKEITTDNNTTTKIEKGLVDIPVSSEAKDVEPTEWKKSTERAKEPAITSVHKDISIITGFEPLKDSEERKSEDLRTPPEAVVMPRESAERTHEDSSAASSSKAYDFLQTGKNSEALHSEPEVTINIGRIEVRAAAMPDKRAPKTQQFPPLSLKEYLKQRSEGRL